MIRRFSLAWSPLPALLALSTLAAIRRRGPGAALLGDPLRRALRDAVARVEPELLRIEASIEWLEAQGAVTRQRAPAGAEGAVAQQLRAGELRLDLTDLDQAARDEPRGIDGRSHSTLFALRTLLRALARDELFTVNRVRVGTRRSDLGELLREVERVAKRRGLRGDAAVPARFATKDVGSKAERRAPETATAETQSSESTEKKPEKKKNNKQGKADEGFGGLPDDAVSDAPPPSPPSDPDTPGVDGRFFLEAAGIEAWPCPRDVLDRARRVVISRLHPDRAGDDSARDFHRAIKGHMELAALLTRLPSPEALQPPDAPPSPDPPAHRAPTRAPKRTRARTVKEVRAPRAEPGGTVQEWPPPPPPPAAPLTEDATFFLREGALEWPCDPASLRLAWSALSSRMRRMTPASSAAASFARASRGYADLMRAAERAA